MCPDFGPVDLVVAMHVQIEERWMAGLLAYVQLACNKPQHWQWPSQVCVFEPLEPGGGLESVGYRYSAVPWIRLN